ncbi:MAG: (d)CMP kinase [Eubacteriales bacterium]|nr:(d)CMP kinase [Eubacteriales bacterium]
MLNIAIDGPAGAGKSTVAGRVAEHLGIIHLDTGAMYRAVGLWALRAGIAPSDERSIALRVAEAEVDVRYVRGAQRVYLNGRCVDRYLRTDRVSAAASAVSALPCVRERMTEMQRAIASRRALVMDGRDIGTVVLPDTPNKFYITATAEERARRRTLQLLEKGEKDVDEAEVLRAINERDHADMTRPVAPLRIAPDATVIDTTHLTIDEAVAAVLERLVL